MKLVLQDWSWPSSSWSPSLVEAPITGLSEEEFLDELSFEEEMRRFNAKLSSGPSGPSSSSRWSASLSTTLLRQLSAFVLREGFGGVAIACAIGLVWSQVDLALCRYSATPVERIEEATHVWPFEPKIRHALLEWPWRNAVPVGEGLAMIMEYQRNDPRSVDARVARGMFEREARKMMVTMKRAAPTLERREAP